MRDFKGCNTDFIQNSSMQIIISSISSLFHFGQHKRTETQNVSIDGERKLFFADSIRPDSSSKRSNHPVTFPSFSPPVSK